MDDAFVRAFWRRSNVTVRDNRRASLSLDGGKVFVSEATITHNVGGGVFAVRGLVNCYTCTIVDNRDPVGTGGSRGVYVGDAVFTMLDSTISGSRTALELEMHATAEGSRPWWREAPAANTTCPPGGRGIERGCTRLVHAGAGAPVVVAAV